MKTKHFFLTVLMLVNLTFCYAQTSAEASGIAIQGIARDDQNTARINQSITLTFELYYIDSSNAEVAIGSPVDANLTTDNFGVFSYVLEPGVANNSIIANQQTYLRISEGATTISNEKLKHVPYAIAANNGVPTGSIMPYVGSAAPEGWVLCDGQTDLNSVVGGEALIALLGTNTVPDLRGFFLRGAGSNQVNGFTANSGPTLNSTQQDDNLAHNHSSTGLTIPNSGGHNHTISLKNVNVAAGIDGQNPTAFTVGTATAGVSTVSTNIGSSAHNHPINGVVSTEGTESRPINYGVNYIIKL